MITKIKFNNGFKQFTKDVETPHDLNKYNLFYGTNGTGKSTIKIFKMWNSLIMVILLIGII